jgi:multiple sugar transport system permease protein
MISLPKTKRTRRALTRLEKQDAWAFYAFISPWLLGFLLLSLAPMLFSLGISFTNFNGTNFATYKFVEWANYARALKDTQALSALWRTISLALVMVPVTQALAFLLALVLNQPIRIQTFFRMIFYIPSILPVVALAWIFRIVFSAQGGLINGIIDLFNPTILIRWMTELPAFVLICLMVWSGTGGITLIYLAGLQNVSTELEDAARIDGANARQVLWHVTIPLMSPIILFQLIQGLMGSLQIVTQPLLLSESTRSTGSLAATVARPVYTIMVHIFQVTFGKNLYGYGSALNWILFVVILVLTIVFFRFSEYWVYYEADVESQE